MRGSFLLQLLGSLLGLDSASLVAAVAGDDYHARCPRQRIPFAGALRNREIYRGTKKKKEKEKKKKSRLTFDTYFQR